MFFSTFLACSTISLCFLSNDSSQSALKKITPAMSIEEVRLAMQGERPNFILIGSGTLLTFNRSQINVFINGKGKVDWVEPFRQRKTQIIPNPLKATNPGTSTQ
jgi:hypothetical protein